SPVMVGLELGVASVDRSSPIWPAQENTGQASGKLSRYVPDGRALARSGRALDLKAGTIEVVELLKGLDQQVVDGKPDRSAPVGISAEEARARFCRFVIQAALEAGEPVDDIWLQGLHREQGDEADQGTHLHVLALPAGQMENVIEEAILVVPEAHLRAASVVHGVGDLDEVLEELGGDALVGGILTRQLQGDRQHVEAE